MDFTIELKDKKGNVVKSYNIQRSRDLKLNMNDFILECLQISEDKRNLPLLIQTPNGSEVYPIIKMKFENYGSSILGDKLEAMHITYK